ncbi:hypothetical protein GCM10009530_15380 [Microbispora corallina]|uniref:Uncharacterized protein n=1 Tax=Microbispora corallina TaxID=83302 RepID=A0ABQ4FXD9_9ACTN|nr:hypothetical protein Mco01_24960 [Microbispora corallina]
MVSRRVAQVGLPGIPWPPYPVGHGVHRPIGKVLVQGRSPDDYSDGGGVGGRSVAEMGCWASRPRWARAGALPDQQPYGLRARADRFVGRSAQPALPLARSRTTSISSAGSKGLVR